MITRPGGVVYALANQKGGVGKTTTAINLAAAVADAGVATLLIDCDPQRASATTVLRIDPEEALTLGEVMMAPRRHRLSDALWETDWGFDFVASDMELANKERNRWTGDEKTLAKQLEAVRGDYGVVLLDCPPNLGVLTVTALVAATGVIVVTEPAYLSLLGLGELDETMEVVRENFNPDLGIRGVIVNKFDGRRESEESVLEVREYFGEEDVVWDPIIPFWGIAREATREGLRLRDLATAPGVHKRERERAGAMADMYDQLAAKVIG